jgi:ABC-2 type transport system permease protein
VLLQLRADPRTVALILLVPSVLLLLMKGVFSGQPGVFQRVSVPLMGVFPLTSMFLVTSITMLRERTSGTLERLLTMPMAKVDLLFGYGLAFAAMALLQAGCVSVTGFVLLGVHTQGATWLVVFMALINALLGMSMGLFVSAFAQTEFQAIQFLPAFLLPQFLLCGLMVPRDRMVRGLEVLSDYLPLSYAYDGLAQVSQHAQVTGRFLFDVAILVGASILALGLGAATLRRRTE